MGSIIEGETKQMPVLDDIMDHDLFGPIKREGIRLGMEQGLEKGLLQCRRMTLAQIINARFGAIPQPLADKLARMSGARLKTLSSRVVHAKTLDELFA